jgi:hypothetical protein
VGIESDDAEAERWTKLERRVTGLFEEAATMERTSPLSRDSL